MVFMAESSKKKNNYYKMICPKCNSDNAGQSLYNSTLNKCRDCEYFWPNHGD